MSRVQIVLLPLKCTWMPKLLQVFLNLSLSPFCVGYYDGSVFVVGTSVVGVVVLVTVNCLYTIDALHVV